MSSAPLVLVTREEKTSGPLSRALLARGLRVRTLPLVVAGPPADPEPLARAAADLGRFDWVVATSARGARALLERVPAGSPRPPLAVVGPGTAVPFRAAGWRPAVIGAGGGVELVARMRENGGDLAGQAVLLPASDLLRSETVAAFEDAGAKLTVVTAYATVEAPGAAEALAARLTGDDPPDAVAFASPSAVEVFARVAGTLPPARRPRAAAIGRTTADALAAHGWDDVLVPDAPGFESLAEALARAFATSP